MSRTLLVISVCAAFGCGNDDVPPVWSQPPLPSEPVEILIDYAAVPHVYAKNDRDAFFGAGYALASDRLLQIDMTRRRALGRWAEVLGPDKVEDDKLARLFDWRGLGRALAKVTARDNPVEWSLVTAWVAGVNRRIDEVRAGQVPLPAGFGPGELDYMPERWSDEDALGISKMTGFGNDLSLEFELFTTIAKQIQPDLFQAVEISRPARDVATIPPEDMPALPGPTSATLPPGTGPKAWHPQRSDGAALARALSWIARLDRLRVLGSNNWAIDGRFTDSGRPLIAGDPHLGFDFPGVLYALHINSKDAGGTLDVEGFALPGTPGVSLGHTDRVAWTATTAFGDVMDVWEVPASTDDGTVEIGGQPMSLSRRTESIVVRGEASAETFDFFDVPGRGVLLPSDIAPITVAGAGHELFFQWTGFDVTRASHLLGLNRAGTIDEFDQAVDLQTGMNFNLVAADASGITYRVGLEVPVRHPAASREPWLVMDGSDPAALWTGEMLPRELLPRGRASERGWLNTANNDPYGFTFDGKLEDDPWYFGAFFDPGWRAGRAAEEIERLTQRGDVTPADVQALQTDVHDNLADDLLPVLAEVWKNAASDPKLAELAGRADLATLVELLTVTWDGRMARDSSGALAFHAFAHLCATEALEDDFSVLFHPAFDLEAVFMLKVADLALTGKYPNGAAFLHDGRDLTVLHALAKTADWLTQRFGGVDPALYRLSDQHVASFTDSLGAGLDYGSAPDDGGEATVNVSPSTFFDGSNVAERWTSHYGPIVRMVTSFADDGTPELQYDFPLGNVADPASPHSKDMLPAWLEGTYHKMPFRRAEVEAAVERRVELLPR